MFDNTVLCKTLPIRAVTVFGFKTHDDVTFKCIACQYISTLLNVNRQSWLCSINALANHLHTSNGLAF